MITKQRGHAEYTALIWALWGLFAIGTAGWLYGGYWLYRFLMLLIGR